MRCAPVSCEIDPGVLSHQAPGIPPKRETGHSTEKGTIMNTTEMVDIARAIREAVALPEDERARRGAAGIAWVTEHHSLPRLAAEFLAVLTDR